VLVVGDTVFGSGRALGFGRVCSSLDGPEGLGSRWPVAREYVYSGYDVVASVGVEATVEQMRFGIGKAHAR
jgi:hypothetical protein